MQYLLIAFDSTDEGALDRRMKVREKHLQNIDVMRKKGEFVCGGAILDDNGKMVGSMITYEFPDRTSLDTSLRDEVYMTKGVWEKVEIRPFRMAKKD